ncbi:MAG: hypothetical protein ACE5HS_21910 [bacterium]
MISEFREYRKFFSEYQLCALKSHNRRNVSCVPGMARSWQVRVLLYTIASRLRLNVRLRGEQSTLTVWQKSAEGIVGVETSPMDRRWGGLTTLKA